MSNQSSPDRLRAPHNSNSSIEFNKNKASPLGLRHSLGSPGGGRSSSQLEGTEVSASPCDPPRRVVERSVRLFPAGSPLQGTEMSVRLNPEASLERLVPLAEFLVAWKLLPNISQWVLHVVEKGYSIQFGSCPPRFQGVLPTVVDSEQALVMEQEVMTLLRKGAIERVSPPSRESGFYSRYFIVPKKDGGLRPILDLRQLNRRVQKLKFKMLTLKQIVSQIKSEDWFVTIDLKDAYFHVSIHPHHRKFLRFAFGGEAYQYRVLPFGLGLSPRTFTKCVDAALAPLRLQGIRILNYLDDWLILAQSEQMAVRHRGVVLAHIEKLGLRLNSKKSVLLPAQRTTFLGVNWDSITMQARLSPARISAILTAVKGNQGVFPEGKSVSHDQGHAAMPSCFGHVEETLVPRSGPSVGGVLSTRNAFDRRFPHGVGRSHERTLSVRSLAGPSSVLAHKLFRNDGRILCSETLPARPERPPRVGPHGQHVGGLIHQPSGGSEVSTTVQAGSSDPPMGPGETTVPQGSIYSGASECRSRYSVKTGAEARGVEASPRGGGASVGEIWASPSRPFRIIRLNPLSSLVLPHTSSPSRTGCNGAGVAEATSVRVPPSIYAPGSSGESSPGRGSSTINSSVLANPSLVLGSGITSGRLSDGDSRQEGPAVPSKGHDISPSPRVVEVVGLASEGAQLIESGLSTEVVETILQSRAPSTRKLYALKWKLFSTWCRDRNLNPVNCPIGTVLDFLQDRFSAGLSPSTLKVYVAAISAYHTPLTGTSVGRDPLIIRFLRGTLRLRPVLHSRAPAWDLAIVLEGLALAPFEPIEEVSEKFLTLKTLFLLAISSIKRIGDLQALSVAPSCLEFAPGMVKAFLHPRLGYIPKVPTNVGGPIVLQAFYPPPFNTPDQENLNLLCPVRALDAYVHRAALWRKSDQLFVCFGAPKKGCPASKQIMTSGRMPEERVNDCHLALTKFIVKGLHPFATVESNCFREMCRALNPKYTPPSRSYLSDTLIPSWYGVEKANVISELKDVPKLAITSDGWTSLRQDHYLTVTVHYTSQGSVKQKILHTRAVYKSQTGEVVAEEISDILEEFEIDLSKIVAKIYKIASIDKWAARIRAVVVWFKRSSMSKTVLTEKQQLLAIQAAALDLRLRKTLSKDNLDRLKDEDFHKAEEFVQLMRILYTSTLCVSCEKNATCGQILPILQKLEEHFTVKDEDTMFVASIKEKVWENLSQRYQKDDIQAFLHEATAMEPRFKGRSVSDATWDRLRKKAVDGDTVTGGPTTGLEQTDTEHQQKEESSEGEGEEMEETIPPLHKTRSALEELFSEEDRKLRLTIQQDTSSLTLSERVDLEVELYKSLPPVPMAEDPVMWWWEKRAILPLLTNVATSYLCAQASSTPSERVFSTAGNTLSQERSRLLPEKANMLIFLQKNG
ncbi:unnamed protein product [Leuciscus chuanchicus]